MIGIDRLIGLCRECIALICPPPPAGSDSLENSYARRKLGIEVASR